MDDPITVTIHVTQRHIDDYAAHAIEPDNCPIFHAAQDAGIKVRGCGYTFLSCEDGDSWALVPLPAIARDLQDALFFENAILPTPAPGPIGFEVRVPAWAARVLVAA